MSDSASTTRAECLKMLEKLVGTGGIPPFLPTPQGGLGGLTGGQMLQHQPERLLEALRSKQEVAAARKSGPC